MRRKITLLCLIAALAGVLVAGATRAQEDERRKIQMAILLDTSGSMSGLIEQAKTQLWSIVNEFLSVQKGGQKPLLQVALYEYGKSSLSSQEGYMRMILPLTHDLDKVSEELFALKTNGGQEYCGMVIKSATEGLAWSKSDADLKVIFIAGNEPFTQGGVDYRKACAAAIRRGIMVNTIFCGAHDTGVQTNWKDGADLADGKYMSIDHNRKTVHINAPQDAEIARLGAELNKTYIPYGRDGEAGAARQKAQDSNAAALAPQVVAERAVSKASGYYMNTSWDLVDAVNNGAVKLSDVKDKQLPEEMQKMSDAERKAYVEKNTREREKIQASIRKLNEERREYIEEKTRELNKSGQETLDQAMIKAVREQAVDKEFEFE